MSMQQSEDAEIVNVVTEAMREADRLFERVGGSTRHHVRDCLLPILNRNGWIIARGPASEVVCECGHPVSAHGSGKPHACITRGCGCKKNQADVLRVARGAVPEGLCTACSVTQYCAEHDPARGAR